MNGEVWKDIEGYDNYMISSFGNVKNVKTGRILKAGVNSSGYLLVHLCVNNIVRTLKIHRLVATSFLPDAENDEQIMVDHINRQKLDNHYLNLRWVSKKQNNQNKNKQQNTTSKYKGVSFHKSNQKWRSQIFINGKLKHLGCFKIERDAGIAYNKACDIYYGEYGNKNIISDD